MKYLLKYTNWNSYIDNNPQGCVTEIEPGVAYVDDETAGRQEVNYNCIPFLWKITITDSAATSINLHCESFSPEENEVLYHITTWECLYQDTGCTTGTPFEIEVHTRGEVLRFTEKNLVFNEVASGGNCTLWDDNNTTKDPARDYYIYYEYGEGGCQFYFYQPEL